MQPQTITNKNNRGDYYHIHTSSIFVQFFLAIIATFLGDSAGSKIDNMNKPLQTIIAVRFPNKS